MKRIVDMTDEELENFLKEGEKLELTMQMEKEAGVYDEINREIEIDMAEEAFQMAEDDLAISAEMQEERQALNSITYEDYEDGDEED